MDVCRASIFVLILCSQSLITTTEDIVTATKDNVTTTEDIVTATKDNVTTTEDIVTATEDIVTTTEDIVTPTEDIVTTTQDDVTTTEDNVTTTEDIVTPTEDIVTTTQDDVTTTEDIVTTTQDDVTTATSCDETLSVEIVNGNVFPNGSILASNGLIYAPDQFWINDSNPDIIRGCICELKICVRKCCAENHMFSGGQCVPDNHHLLQTFPLIQDGNQKDIHVFYGRNFCESRLFSAERLEEYKFHSNGQLIYEDETLSPNDYCLELVVQNDSNLADVKMFHCFFPPSEPEENVRIIYLVTSCLIISEPFLLATFLVYAMIPELRNVQGKNIMSHVFSLFVGFLFLIFIQLEVKEFANESCITNAILVYFFFLASFFWLNVMCFDLWWTFRRSLIPYQPHGKRFFLYSLYAWGSPLIMLTVAMIMHFTADPTSSYILPGFGVVSCWFSTQSGVWAYFIGPVAVILTVNLLMFLTTAIKIVQLQKETAMLESAESTRNVDESKQRFTVFLKLFLVMGISWVMDVISSAVGGSAWVWIVTDIINALQGVLIFLIAVWNPRVRDIVKRRLQGTCGRCPFTVELPTQPHSQSSLGISEIKRNNCRTN